MAEPAAPATPSGSGCGPLRAAQRLGFRPVAANGGEGGGGWVTPPGAAERRAGIEDVLLSPIRAMPV